MNTFEVDDNYDFPPYLRFEKLAPLEDAKFTLERIDVRIAWLAERGLRAHPEVLNNRQHCIDFINGDVSIFEKERFIRRAWF